MVNRQKDRLQEALDARSTDEKKALRILKKLAEERFNDPEVYLNLTAIYKNRKDWVKLIYICESAQDLGNRDTTFVLLINAAHNALEQRYADLWDTKYLKAVILLDEGQLYDAEIMLKTNAQQLCDISDNYVQLARFYKKYRQQEKIVLTLRQAITAMRHYGPKKVASFEAMLKEITQKPVTNPYSWENKDAFKSVREVAPVKLRSRSDRKLDKPMRYVLIGSVLFILVVLGLIIWFVMANLG